MKKADLFVIVPLLLVILFSGCTSRDVATDIGSPVKIAISKAVPEEAFQNYLRWIRHADSSAEYVDMYHLDYDSALSLLLTCDGLLLTGGTDIYPGRYGKEEDTSRCWRPDFKRDTLEAELFRAALDARMPIMGICRGLQLINVEMGGTLYIDLPTDLDTLVRHSIPDTYDAAHEITTTENGVLQILSGTGKGIVNSAHHQGIEILGKNLISLASAPDGLIESITLDSTYSQYLLAVQWHPERMEYSSPLSGLLAHRFITEARKFKTVK